LKIPNGKSEAISRRRIYNSIAKRKTKKRTNNDLPSIT